MNKIKNPKITYWSECKEKIDEIMFPITIITGVMIETILRIAYISLIIIAILMVLSTITKL